jgi:predicted regulator of Ras-like GTPase activity (Roadblock/LC7/MglB family)
LFFFNRQQTLVQLLKAAGLCLVSRVALGVAFGLLITAAYSLNLRISVTFGIASYLPVVLLHVAAMPFVLYPVLKPILQTKRSRRAYVLTDTPSSSGREGGVSGAPVPPRRPAFAGVPRSNRPVQMKTVARQTAAPTKPRPKEDYEPISLRPKRHASRSTASSGVKEPSGFEKAVNYIGEHGSVKVAAVVDLEGLLLANFCRGGVEADEWSPYAPVFFAQNEIVLERTDMAAPEKIDIILSDHRLTIARDSSFYLMVLAERQADDLLGIRITQAMEMIRKYIGERYSEDILVNAESIHV